MKKEYSKPMAIVEDFSLQTSIAAGCDNTAPLPTQGICGYPLRSGDTIFTEDIDGCKYKNPDGYNGICYHNPSDDTNLFNS